MSFPQASRSVHATHDVEQAARDTASKGGSPSSRASIGSKLRTSLKRISGHSTEADVQYLGQKLKSMEISESDDTRRASNSSLYNAGLNTLKVASPTKEALSARVANPHALTARAVASARAEESERADSLFNDPLAHRLAGAEGKGRGVPLVVQRTRFMDDFLCAEYDKGVRQAVLLGAGMDARAFRLGLFEMHFFEVDQSTIFEVKEPLLCDVPLQAASRQCVASMVEDSKLADKLIASGFDPRQPSAWVLEGLMMYLNPKQTARMMTQLGKVIAPGSAVVHESLSGNYLSSGISYCGAKFTGCSDEYDGLWAKHAGFDKSEMIDFSDVGVDRSRRALRVDRQRGLLTKSSIRGRTMMYFTTMWKTS